MKMKKYCLTAAMLAFALGSAACSSKGTQETAAPETSAAETEAVSEADDEDEIEEADLTGVITAVDDDILTILSDNDDSEKQYDVSAADIEYIQNFPLAEGDQVYLTYPEDTTEDPIPVILLEVEVSVIAESTDPTAEGTVINATLTTISIEMEDGSQYIFGTANANIVGSIALDKLATITYIGDIDDDALAVKVVMEDMYGTDEAEVNAFIGEAVQIEDGNVVLRSDDDDFYSFVSDDIDFDEFSVGDTLRIVYEGSITAKEIPALEITVK